MPASLRPVPSARSIRSTCIATTRGRPSHLPTRTKALRLSRQQSRPFRLRGSAYWEPTHRHSHLQRNVLSQTFPSVHRQYSSSRRTDKKNRSRTNTWAEELDEKPDLEGHRTTREDLKDLRYKLRLEMESRGSLSSVHEDMEKKYAPGGYGDPYPRSSARRDIEKKYATGGYGDPVDSHEMNKGHNPRGHDNLRSPADGIDLVYLNTKHHKSFFSPDVEFEPAHMQECTSTVPGAKPNSDAASDSHPSHHLGVPDRDGRRNTRKSKEMSGNAAETKVDSPHAVLMRDGRAKREKSAGTAPNESYDHDYYIDPVTNRKVKKPIDSHTETETETSTIDASQLKQQRTEQSGSSTHTTCDDNVARDQGKFGERSGEIRHTAGHDYPGAQEVSFEPQVAFGTRRQSSQPTETEEVYLGPRTKASTSLGAENRDKGQDQKDVSGVSQGNDEAVRPLTGNYVKDFPEDFSASWAEHYKVEKEHQEEEAPLERLEPAMSRTTDGSIPTEHPPLESRATQTSSSSSRPKAGHRTAEEEDAYDLAASAPEPAAMTLYKILAYDHHTRTIVTADASSTVIDSVEKMTPAEVLPRVHKPAKFLPHFAPLQAQGYEVISGSGDVLIFRKVREATEPGSVFMWGATGRSVPDTAGKSGGTQGGMSVNPIDMMGSEPVTPNIGNFTSPTGYINYEHDLLSGDGESGTRVKPPPPFRNGAGASKGEETAGSAADNASGSQKSKGKGKRLLWRSTVGAGYLAALFYGGSVMADYFATGGETGGGPKGTL